MTDRISWVDYFLQIADAVATRADCTRRKVGAVVVDSQTKHIISTGYNGAAPGEPGCLSDGACPRGRHYKKEVREGKYLYFTGQYACACGNTWPCSVSASPGSSYDTGPGSCIALHAELNACIRAGERALGATLYCTDEPCDGCIKVMKSARLQHVVWYGGSMELCHQPPEANSLLSRLVNGARSHFSL